MNIQANLNSLLTMGAVAVRTSGKYKRNLERHELGIASKAQAKFNEQLLNELSKNPNATTAELLAKGSDQLKEMQVRKAQLQLNPKETEKAVEAAGMTKDADEMVDAFKKADAAKQELEAADKAVKDQEIADKAAEEKGLQEVISSMTPQEYTLFHELEGDTKTKIQQMYQLEDRKQALKQKEADMDAYFKSIGFETGGKR